MPNIIDQIVVTPKPGDLAAWWKKQDPKTQAAPLDEEESDYMAIYTSDAVEPVLRIGRGIANPGNLDQQQQQRSVTLFGTDPMSKQLYCNYENRRRIVSNYVWTHPATVAYEMELYRMTRDVIPPFFIAERVYELFSGKEAFTGDETSRIRALVDIAIVLIVMRGLKAVTPVGTPKVSTARTLTDPIYDLPPEGGGMKINGNWYTEHALERMAPDTPQIRAELRARAIARIEKLGLQPGSTEYDKCLARALSKIDPRGVPPSVVEAEILHPGSTNVKVIYIKRLMRVVTVIPKG